jgi:tyrosyl-tRNA synthetase
VTTDLLADLEARGLLQDSTDRDRLRARLSEGPITLYYGCDPTADSLHIGNLIGLLVLRRFHDAGHRPIALAGGATGMIGDPGGKSEERNLLDEETLAANLAGIKPQIARIVGEGVPLVDNHSWTADIPLLAFLRDVGKHVTVNHMVAKESVRARMEGENGISFTEFSYMLLQANDYWWLHVHEGCELQIGGSDQWGNIVLGVDLIRRREGHHVHAFSWPLIVRADGKKYGKSEGNAMWLDAGRTSPFELYQYWMQVADADVRRFLLQLTLLSVEEANAVADAHEAAPEKRVGQRRLARENVTVVHGAASAAAAEEATELLFGSGDATTASPETFEFLAGAIPTSPLPAVVGRSLVDLLPETGLASSKSDARRTLDQGGVALNGTPATVDTLVSTADLLHGRWVLLRKGKRRHLLDAGAS